MSRILIVEDEPGIASFLEKGLRAEGFTTMTVEDGVSAAAIARDEAFDLMILDLGLPGKDGREVLSEIRGRGERMPVIILTGLAMSPGMNAAWGWLIDIFGGRQSARSIHFICAALIVLFAIVHVLMVLASGPLNQLRGMITGRVAIREDQP